MPTTTAKTTRKYPAPLYAAAGAGELAYQTLRTLPAKLRTGNIDVNADIEKLRAAARRNAKAFVESAQHAQERAVEFYTDLVARGEKVVQGAARTTEAKVVEIGEKAAADEAQTAKVTKPAPKPTRPAAKSA